MAGQMLTDDWSNDVLKEAFQAQHLSLVNNLDASHVMDYLFAVKILTANDLEDLESTPNRRKKVTNLVILLHRLENPRAFIELRNALLSDENEDKYKWLVKEVEKIYYEINQSRKPIGPTAITKEELSQDLKPNDGVNGKPKQQEKDSKTLENRFAPTATLIRSLAGDEPIWSVTTLDSELYVWYDSQSNIAVYDKETFSVRRDLSVEGLGGVRDMVSCKRHQCIYILDHVNYVIHRVEKVNCQQTKWNAGDKPTGLSVNSEHNVIVTFDRVSKIKVFTTHGNLVKEIDLQLSNIKDPWHSVQVTTDQYVVSHGFGRSLHRVVIVDGLGRIQQSYGDRGGSNDGQLNFPCRLAVAKNDFILVADHNKRVVMLTTSLRYVMCWNLGGWPHRMWFDEETDRLYVTVNRWNDELEIYTGGSVEVYSLKQ